MTVILSPNGYLKMEPKADTSNEVLLIICFQRKVRGKKLEQ